MTTITERPETTSTDEGERTLLYLDPAALLAHPSNPRKKLRAIKELTASIKEVGVVQALLVARDDDGYVITAGWRRASAAVEAGLDVVPCLVKAVPSDQLTELKQMVAENVNRDPLSAGEEAAAYRQMQLAGMPASEIAKVAGRRKAEVEQAIEVGASEVAVAVANKFDLTMHQAAGIAEFADDKDVVKELTGLAVKSPGGFEHRLSRLRQDREVAEANAAVRAACEADGLTVVEETPAAAGRVRDLYDEHGESLSEAKHRSCPGHAVYLHADWSGRVHPVAICRDWQERGHKSSVRSTATSGSSDEERAARREVIENNKAWRAAEPVRKDFLARLCARKQAPKGLLRYVADEVLRHPSHLDDDNELLLALVPPAATSAVHPYGAPLAAVVEDAPDARLPLLLFAQVAASVERTMGVHTWRDRFAKREATYLSFLAEQGYEPSEVEQRVVDQALGNPTEDGEIEADDAAGEGDELREADDPAPVDEAGPFDNDTD